MEDTTTSVIAIIIAAILMLLVPLVIIADRNDDLAVLSVQTLTAEFVDQIIKTGKLTENEYQSYLNSLSTTGNTYEVDIEIKILDDNTSKRQTMQTNNVGENSYYSIYSTQIEEKLFETGNDEGFIILKEGDIVSVVARNSSKTLSQSLKNIYYTIKDEDLHIIVGAGTGTVSKNGIT